MNAVVDHTIATAPANGNGRVGIEFQGVNKTFDDGTVAIQKLDLEIGEGEFVVFVGPSGCGKTTALRIVAGLEEATAGDVLIGDRVVTELDPQHRDLAMVFQNYALYPHKTVYDNLAYPLRVRKMSKDEIAERVNRAADLLGLSELLKRKPGQLSGGQRQRVAMGRALVREPVAFLMDEPLSNLDAALRVEMRAEIRRIHDQLGVTTVYVTHDQVEAMTMGDRVAVMRDGVLQQFDAPQELYLRPRNIFVAGFVGSPAINLALGYPGDSAASVKLGDAMIPLRGNRPTIAGRPAGAPVAVGIRPEAFSHRPEEGYDASMNIVPVLVETLGSELLVHFTVSAPPVDSADARAWAEADAETVSHLRDTAEGERFVARLDAASGCQSGAPAELWFSSDRVLLFDPESGDTLATTS
jgi:multiple sugar transport system ATP-binding protein